MQLQSHTTTSLKAGRYVGTSHDADEVALGIAVYKLCFFGHPGTLTLRTKRQSAWMSKTTNDGLTQSGTDAL